MLAMTKVVLERLFCGLVHTSVAKQPKSNGVSFLGIWLVRLVGIMSQNDVCTFGYSYSSLFVKYTLLCAKIVFTF